MHTHTIHTADRRTHVGLMYIFHLSHKDINECENSPCEQICTDLVGSFMCSCGSGYTVNPSDPVSCDGKY